MPGFLTFWKLKGMVIACCLLVVYKDIGFC